MQNINQSYTDAAWQHLDQLTKPLRSLGRVEEIAAQLCTIQHTNHPQTKPRSVIVFAGDHGVCEEGVSAFPQSVTIEMMKNMASGGAAVSVLSILHFAKLRLIDVGSLHPKQETIQGVERRLVKKGTRNFVNEPAMTPEECQEAIEIGKKIVREEYKEGTKLLLLGEMGIGNTTSASAICAAILNTLPEQVTGRGTGLDDQAWNQKIEIVKKALAAHPTQNTMEVLTRLGGLEIAAMAGAMIEASHQNIPILLDGFIVSAAALVAYKLEPSVWHNLIASHVSVECGHKIILDDLQLKPLLDLDMRLGEASGALIALPILDAAAAIYNEMATFESANVSSQTQS